MSRRALFALVGAVLWLGGVEVVPNLHLALHDSLPAHVHQGDRTIFMHEGHVHRPAPKRRSAHELALRLEHGASSLAHHSLAVYQPALPVLAPLPIDVRPTLVAQIAITEPRSRRLVRAVARGPPASRTV